MAFAAQGVAPVAALQQTACQLAEAADPGACLGLEKTVTGVALTPGLALQLSGPASAVPGDDLDYEATLTNSGSTLSLSGRFRAKNSAADEAKLASYFDYLEYYSKADLRWVPLAGAAAKRPGYSPRLEPPLASALALSASPVAASGVSYPASGDRLLDTAIAQAATAAWNYTASVELTPAQIALLLDSERVGSVRNVVHFELTRPTAGGSEFVERKTRKTFLTKQLRTQSGDLRGAEITLTPPSGSAVQFDSSDIPALSRLEPGTSVTANETELLPPLAAKGQNESDSAYLARLDAADGASLEATAAASGKANGEAVLAAPGENLTGNETLDEIDRCELIETDDCRVTVGADRSLVPPDAASSASRRLPRLTLAKSGPARAAAGATLTYDLSLEQAGSATASAIDLRDSVEGGASTPSLDAPATLEPGVSATAHASYDVPESRPNGPLSDVARLSWQDRNQNSYGPISDEFTTRVISSMLDAPPVNRTSPTSFFDATKFLYTGDNPIQEGVIAGAIEPKRAAVIRGRVLSRAGAPLFGVKATVAGHAEYGFSESRPDGAIYLAVNGGGPLIVRFEKDGYLPLEREIEVPWQDYAQLEDVALTPLDTQVSDVDLDSSSEPIQVARGSEVTDADGTRRQTLFFEQGTDATMTLPGGGTQALGELDVRASEYTVGDAGPEAMPADLPPQSGYTYAAELSVDQALAAEATEISFSKPVLSYTDNFVAIPVGAEVPVGYYDQEKGAWVASDNGRVVKLVSEAGGVAELDIDGSGDPATASELAALGVSVAERQELSELYDSGKELWRVSLEHFSSVDYNWSIAPPGDAESPPGSLRPGPVDDPCRVPENSVIDCENQALEEDLALTGSELGLHYQSDRVPGRKADDRLEIPVSDESVPASLKWIDVEVYVAGRRFTERLPDAPNQNYVFTWDGKDAFGRALQGEQLASVRVGYAYDGVYQGGTTRFAEPGSESYEVRSREGITLWRDYRETIGHWDASGQGLGGWTLDVHHAYDPVGEALYLGDGTKRSAESVARTIETAFVVPQSPEGVDVAPDGSLYVCDYYYHRIWKVSPSGQASVVAGTGAIGYSGDGGQATQAQLAYPEDVAVGPDGSLYIADKFSPRIRKVSPDGVITTVAGNGTYDTYGEGVPATQAAMKYPVAVAVAPDGTLYFAQEGAYYEDSFVRRVGTDGIITTVAGSSFPSFGGDGGPAKNAPLRAPHGLAVGPDGSLYIADSGNLRVRRVTPDGIIKTVAGNGSGNHTGDGGPATQAGIADLEGVDVAPDGTIYIAEYGGYVRRVDPSGKISTVAGWGTRDDPLGDGGPATHASIDIVKDVAVAYDGSLAVAEWGRRRVRRVRPRLPGFTGAEFSIPSEDGRELYQFNSSGRHLRTVDSLTGATLYSFSYDSVGRLSSVTDGDGNLTTIERDTSGKPEAIVAPFGQRTELSTNANGYISAATNPEQETTSLGYSAGGLLASLTDPKAGSASYTYDSLGRLERDDDRADGYKTLDRTNGASSYETTLRSALGRETKYKIERLPAGDLRRTFTDPSGLQTTVRKGEDATTTTNAPTGMSGSLQQGPDPRFGMNAPLLASATTTTPGGRQLSTQGSRQATLSNPGDPLSLQTQTDTLTVNGRSYTSAFNASSRRFSTTSPANRTTTTDIDAQGRPLSEQVSGLNALSSTYDARGLLTAQAQGTRTWSYTYHPSGFLATATDSLARTTAYAYDGAGRLTRVTLPGNREIAYSYDLNGNLASITPPSRPAHGFDHTAVDLLSDYTPPDLGPGGEATHYTYNADRDLTKITRPDDTEISFGYDAGGRIESITRPGGTTQLAYSSQTGNLSSATAPGNEGIAYEYDGSLPTREIFSGTVSASVSRTYDNDLRIASSSVNGANTVAYSYDADSLLTGAGELSLTRNSLNGLLSSTSLQNAASSITYNGFGEPATLSANYDSNTLYSATYTRDDGGRIAQKTETTSQGTDTYAYTYDDAGRLTDVTKNGQPLSHYDYDANGNRLSKTRGGIATYGTYDAQDRLTDYGAYDYTYTAGGDLHTKTDSSTNDTTTYDYDALGSLTEVTLPDNTEIDYVIDAEGRRIAKKVDGQLEQGFLYGEEALGPVAELDSQGNVESRFVYATRSNVPDHFTKNGTVYRIITDDLGSPRVVVNSATGAIAQELDYDEFGKVTRDSNPGFQPFSFAGGLYDMDTKLVRFGARDYDPETGRWTAKDPIGFAGGDTNVYGYVLNDPINLIDPRGLFGVPNPIGVVKAGANWVTDRANDGYDFITNQAQRALEYYANLANNPCSSWLERALAHVGGSLSALATADNLPLTALTLSPGGAGAAAKAARAVPDLVRKAKARAFKTGGRTREIDDKLKERFPRAWPIAKEVVKEAVKAYRRWKTGGE